MSTDFYVAVNQWPDQATMQSCMVDRGYPVVIERYPAPEAGRINDDGILVKLSGQDVYLEGSLYPGQAGLNVEEMQERGELAELMGASSTHSILTLNVRAHPGEFAATAYMIGALTICFDGVIFDPQSNQTGGAAMAQAMIEAIALVDRLGGNADR